MSIKIASLFVELTADNSKVKGALNETQGDLSKTSRVITNTGLSFGEFASMSVAALTIAGGAVKGFYDIAASGAQLESMRQRFDNLARSIGATSDVMLKDLRAATGGIYSDLELMTSASDFVALGFAKTSDEAVRLATVAGALNMNMNQLVLTLANKTTMRFDQLGVAVEGFDEKLQNLKDTGMDADAAFQEAFLQQAEAQILKVGRASESASSSFMVFEAELKNITNTGQSFVSQFAEPTVFVLGRMLQSLRENADNGLGYGEGKLNLFGLALDAVRERVEMKNGSLDAATQNYMAMAKAVEDAAKEERGFSEEAQLTTEELKRQNEEASRLNQSFLGLVDQFVSMEGRTAEEVEKSTRRIVLSMLERQLAMDGLNREETNYLLDLGVKWGVYTASAVAEAQKAMDQVYALTGALNNLPGYKSITIEAIFSGDAAQYVSSGSVVNQGRRVEPEMRALGGPVNAGGVYQVNERGDPELLTVGSNQYLLMGRQAGYVAPTQSGGGAQMQTQDNGDLVAAIYDMAARTAIDYDRLARAMRDAVLLGAE